MIHSTKSFDGGTMLPKPYERLAAAIVTNAVKDFFSSKDLETQLDVLLWLSFEEAKFYMESLNMNYDPLLPLCDGPQEYRSRSGRHKRGRK